MVAECDGHQHEGSIFALETFPHHHDETRPGGYAGCGGVNCVYCEQGAPFYALCRKAHGCCVTGHQHLTERKPVAARKRRPRRNKRPAILDEETGLVWQ